MSPAEWIEFAATFDGEMPTLADHAKKHPALLASWRREIEDLDLQDAIEGLRRMRRGEAERPGFADRDFFPGFLQSAVSAIRHERLQEKQAAEDSQKHLRSGAEALVKVGMKDLFQGACEVWKTAAEADDDPRAAVHEYVASQLAHVPEDRRDRVRCRICRDNGTVECWDVRAMTDARNSILNDRQPNTDRWRTCHVSCSCQAGKTKWVSRTGNSTKETDLPRYDETKWVCASSGEQALLEWAAKYRPPNYSDFGEYGAN